MPRSWQHVEAEQINHSSESGPRDRPKRTNQFRENVMALLSIEHSRAAYWADLGIYGAGVVSVAGALASLAPHDQRIGICGMVLLGIIAWTLLEYSLHRFVLHGLEPFRSWHAQHHDRPTALLGTPTLVSVSLFLLLLFWPTLAAAGPWYAAALTLGATAGYLAYALTHHAVHHCRATGRWMVNRKRWHARHHRADAYYGVTSPLWDHVFGSAEPVESRRSTQ
jgi:sterol desaturase/sphingolipid hydroxylase (fatty acid hydroxylase superfamily)